MPLQVIINFFLLVTLIAMIVINIFLLLKKRDNITETKYHGVLEKLNKDLQGHVNELSGKVRQLSTIQSISSVFVLSENLDQILHKVIHVVTRALDCKVGSIMIFNKDKNILSIKAAVGLGEKIIASTRIKLGEEKEISGWVAQERQPLLIENIEKSRFSGTDNPIYEGKSLLCVPIISKGALFGVINCTNKNNRELFTQDELSSLVAIASQTAILIENVRAYHNVATKDKEHSTLCSLSEKINLSLNLEETLDYIAKMATEITNAELCSLRLLDDEDKSKLLIRAGHNLSDEYMRKGPLEMGEGVGGYVAEHAEPVAIGDIRKDKRVDYNEFLKNEGLIALLSVPIKSKIRVIGLISVYKKSPHEFEQNDIDLLSAFANHVSVAIENAKLYDTIKKNYLETIETLALTIEARDLYTRGHSERVTNYAIGIAKELDVEEELLEIIRYAGRLHDIGKIAIPDRILNKPDKLTTAEFAEIKTHPTKGAELVEPLEFLKDTVPMIKHHHERFDGRGYPDGLEKMNIPLIARILAVADSFDAMTSRRPYRQKPMDENEAIEELKKNKGTQFDPEAVDAFIKTIKQR